jgi:hypothetical protein
MPARVANERIVVTRNPATGAETLLTSPAFQAPAAICVRMERIMVLIKEYSWNDLNIAVTCTNNGFFTGLETKSLQFGELFCPGYPGGAGNSRGPAERCDFQSFFIDRNWWCRNSR